MKTDRLNVHYETLYEIIMNRYDGLTPETIKQTLIHSNFDLGVKHSQKKQNKNASYKKS